MPNLEQLLRPEVTSVVIVIRPDGGDGQGFGVDDVMTIEQWAKRCRETVLRHRYNPEMRACLVPFMPGMDLNVFAEALCENQEELAKLYASAKNLG